MNAEEWSDMIAEWEATKIALDAAQQDIDAEIKLYLAGKGLGPTWLMVQVVKELQQTHDVLRAQLNAEAGQLFPHLFGPERRKTPRDRTHRQGRFGTLSVQ